MKRHRSPNHAQCAEKVRLGKRRAKAHKKLAKKHNDRARRQVTN